MNNALETVPEKRKQLFEARFDGGVVEKGVIITSPTGASSTADLCANSVPTRLDSFASPRDGSRHDSISSEAGSRSNSRLSIKENNQKVNVVSELGSSKRPLEFDNNDSIEFREEKTPKAKRTEIVIDSPEPEKANIVVSDSGSRGAGGVKNTLKKYFISQNDTSASSSSSFNHISSSSAASAAHTTTEAVSMPPPSTKAAISAMPGSSTSHIHATGGKNSGGGAGAGMANITVQQQQLQINTIVELKKQSDALKIAKELAENKAIRIEEEFRSFVDKFRQLEDKNARLTKALEDVQRSLAQQEMRRRRDKLALDNVRLGRIVTTRTNLGGTSHVESWEGGYRRQEIFRLKESIKERKEELEARKKRIQAMKKRAARKQGGGAAGNASELMMEFGGGGGGVVTQMDATGPGFVSNSTAFSAVGAAGAGGLNNSGSSNSLTALSGANGHNHTHGGASNDKERDVMDNDMDLNTETEVIRIHMEQLKKDELAAQEEERHYLSEKAVHLKELKRCQCEENSHFFKADLPVLHDRYLLQSMLGRGGFSEVWKAYDLSELREVAVKVHQLNNNWSDERKHSYIKHVTREYTIHRDMKHPRVVQLFDVFEIDGTAFATVLEYCRGIDLDEKLKRQKTIPEKDAKAIFMQIMSGLRYLNRPLSYLSSKDDRYSKDEDYDNNNNNNNGLAGQLGGIASMGPNRKMTIIHFDLKPANILFDEVGDVKITDFGLSKIIDESNEGTSMELTSQGAGTYWYLPPECFAKGSEAPRISSKVDVWSAGIIFYQMLYGARPYGEGSTQERVWSEGLIANAGDVNFPLLPKVSDEAKDVIRQCLTRDPRARPDVVTVCQHGYMNK